MNHHLTVIPGKRACSFILHISDATDTLGEISALMKERKVAIDALQMYRYRNGEANLILHCHIERDRINLTQDKLSQLKGVLELEKLEAR